MIVNWIIKYLKFTAYTAYVAHICLGIALLLRRNWREALAELEQALQPTRSEEWKAHFWQGMAYAFLEQDEKAMQR
jgi:Flp pilus assembly protein TadD